MRIKISKISKIDYEDICEMILELAKKTSLRDHAQAEATTENLQHIKNVILRCDKVGHSFIARDNENRAVGIMLSLIVEDLWCRKILRLHEVGFYIRDVKNKIKIGAMLFQKYVTTAEALIRDKKISSYTMCKIPISGNFNLEKRGFTKIQTTYLKEII